MDRVSHLPDEILSKILSSLVTKDVMPTMLLSKRWKYLWKSLPRLEFDDTTHFPEPEEYWKTPESQRWKFWWFVDRCLMSREGHLLQSLYLTLALKCTDGDIAFWIENAVKSGLMELNIQNISSNIMPKSMYTCETLVVLKLLGVTLDVPELVCLRSLKTLSLTYSEFYHDTGLLRLLPNCPVLEDLFIKLMCHDHLLILKIVVPSLKRLSLINISTVSRITGLVLDAPSLNYLRIVHDDSEDSPSFSESINIPQVVEADLDVILNRPEKLLHSLALVERIRLCLSASEVVYPVGSCFRRLKRLEVCTCKSKWLDLFMHLLKDSPSLKVIKISQGHLVKYPRPRWNQPASVPTCLSSNLESFEWLNYQGTQEEKELSTYILKTAVCLKKASFAAFDSDPNKKLQMLQELSLSPRASSICELVFN